MPATAVDVRNASLKSKLESKLIQVDADLEEIRASDKDPAWKAHQEDTIGGIMEQLGSALERIEAGTFGKCVVCGNDIDETQLLNLPHVAECADCRNAAFPPGLTDEMRASAGAEEPKPKNLLERAREHMGLDEPDGDEPDTEDLQKEFIEAAADDGQPDWTPPSPPDAPSWDGSIENSSNGSGPARTESLVDRAREALIDRQGNVNGGEATEAVDAAEKRFTDDPIPQLHKGQVRDVPLSKIHPAPDNDREELDETEVKELAESIAGLGTLLQRIALTPIDGTDEFEIIGGHKRHAALELLGWEFAPSEIFDRFTAAQIHAARLIENVQRSNLAPLEEAKALSRLIDEFGYTQHALSRTIGMPQPTMSKRLALLELTEPARAALAEGKINLQDARELLRLKAHPKKLDRVLEDHLKYEYDVPNSVKRELDDVARLEKIAAARKKLKSEGVRIYGDGPLTYNANKCDIGKRVGQLNVDRKAHATEPCHAAQVDHNGRVTLICTDIKRHRARAGESKLKGKVVERPKNGTRSIPGLSEEELAEQTAWNEANEARQAFLKRLLAGRVSKDEVATLMASLLIHNQYGEIFPDMAKAAHRLDLAAKESGARPQLVPVLDEFVSMKDGNASKLLLAVAIGYFEDDLRDLNFRGGFVDEARPYFKFLQKQGYELSDVESAYIEPPTKEAKKTKGVA